MARADAALAELSATGTVQPYEKEYFRKDGSRVPVLSARRVRGRRDQGVTFVLDLTERKRAEEALREAETKLRQFIESVPCHFWSANPDGEPTYVNQRLLDYFGMRFEDQKSIVTGRRSCTRTTSQKPKRLFITHFELESRFQRVHRLRRADGEYRWHRARVEPLRDHSRNIIQWYGFSIDIDEAKKAEDALRRDEAWLSAGTEAKPHR